MESEEEFFQDIDDFKMSVKLLSDNLNKSKVNWKDNQFEKLFKSISEIASSSKDVLEAGNLCRKELKKFTTILK